MFGQKIQDYNSIAVTPWGSETFWEERVLYIYCTCYNKYPVLEILEVKWMFQQP